MVIIGIVGRPGSGKEEAALYLSKEWGFQLHKLPFLDYCLLLKKEKINLKEEYLSKNKLNNEENKMDSLVICKKQLLDFDVNQVIYPIYSMEQVKYMRFLVFLL